MQFMNFWRRPTVSTISSHRSKRHGVGTRHRRGLHRPEVLEQRTVLAASIGFVWNDLNTDGIQNGGELGVAGVTVQLLDSSNAVFQTTTTNGTGNYSFPGLAAGTYSIKTTAPVTPVSYGFSPADQGSNNAIDSDHLSYLGRTASFTLGAADTFTADIGLAQKFTVDIPDVTWVSSPTVPLVGYVDVKFTNVPGGSFIDKLSAYNAGIILTPVGGASGGVTWFVNSTTMTHDAIEPGSAIFPGQNPQDFTSSGNLHYVADNLSASAENQILDNQGIFRLQFTIPVGATGDYQLTFDPDNTLFFDALSNQITNLDLSAGTIHLVPAISVTAVTASANEGNGGTPSRSFNVTLSHPSTQTITVLVNTSVDGTATAADGDFTPIVNQLLTFTPGTVTLPVSVNVNGDNKVELDESFSLALSNATNAVIQGTPAVTTLVNDDQATVSINSVSTNEGNGSGITPLVFTVTLSNPVDTSVSVPLSVADMTALLLDSDYALTGTPTVTFAANTTTAQFYTVNINRDNKLEQDETFKVTLASPVAAARNVVLGTAVGVGTITNDDTTSILVTNAAGNASIFEGQPAGSVQELTFLVSLTNPVDVPVGITISTALGTPGSGIALADDFTATSQIHSFTAGTTTAYEFKVAMTRDNIVELDEIFNVVLSSLNVATGYAPSITTSSTAVGTIRNDDQATVSINSVSTNEGNGSGITPLVFTVTLSNPVDTSVSVPLSVADMTALLLDSDYALTGTPTVTFAANTTTAQFYTVNINRDNKLEQDETFKVTLASPVAAARNVVLGTAVGVGTITNDDTTSILVTNAAGNASIFEGQPAGSVQELTFLVSLTNPVDVPVGITISTALGTPGSGIALADDFTATSQIHSFTAGTTTAYEFKVAMTRDNIVELDEIFNVVLSSLNVATGYAPSITTSSTAVGTIRNDDQATVSINSVSTNEGNGSGITPLVFTVTLSNPVDTSVSVPLSVADMTALLLDSDYALTGTPTVTFAANTTTAQFYTVNINRDNKLEQDETFKVTLASPVAAARNVVLGTAVGVGTITNDDTTSILVTNAAGNASIFEGQPAGSVQELTFLVSLTNPVDVPVGITISTALGTPGSGIALADDFTATSQIHSFTAGTTTAYEFKVAMTRDNIVELDEIFNVVLGSLNVATGYAPSITTSSTAVGTIRNDDTATISVTSDLANASITEGQTGDTNILNFTVTLSNPVDEATTVTISTALLTPGAGIALANDFIANSVTHTFGIGQTTFSFPVTLSGDLLNEVNETFAVNLSNPVTTRSVTLGSNAIGTIINDDFDVTGPKVQGIYVRSTSWSASYLNRLAANGVGDATLGYRLDVGAAQLDDLAWVNLNQISIVFNEDVVISNDDIKLRGINVPEHTLVASYSNTTTRIATWNLAASTVIGRDKLLVQLSSNATTGVLDINGNPLDGNSLTNNTSYSAFPTGDGVNGGDLTFRFDVLPGNTDRGVAPGTLGVFGGDVTRVRDTQFSLISNSAYPIYFDVNGDGVINGGDVNNVRDRQFTNLPVGEPVSTSFASFFAQLAEEESTTQTSASAPQVQSSQAEMYWYALGSSPQETTSDVLTSGKRKAWLNT